ncbi:MAG: hypothetical protein B7Y75_02595, partial [Azorhizobium sp. 35-67-5]
AVATLIYAFVRALNEYPLPSWRTVLLFGIALGLTIGTRVLGVIAVAYSGFAIALLVTLEWRSLGLRQTALRLGQCLGLMALGLPLAYLVLGIIWPWAVVDPLNPIKALSYYSHFWEVPWRELYEGRPVLVPDMPRTYVPTLFAIQMPELFLGLSLAGAAGRPGDGHDAQRAVEGRQLEIDLRDAVGAEPVTAVKGEGLAQAERGRAAIERAADDHRRGRPSKGCKIVHQSPLHMRSGRVPPAPRPSFLMRRSASNISSVRICVSASAPLAAA